MKKLIIMLPLIAVMIMAACGSDITVVTQSPSSSETAFTDSAETVKPDVTSAPKPTGTPAAEVLRYNEYTVNLEYFPEDNTVAAIERIKYRNRTGVTLDKIYINVYINAFSLGNSYKPFFAEYEKKIFASGVDYARFKVLSASVDKEEAEFSLKETVLTVTLGRPLEPGGEAEIALSFEAYIPEINHRTGRNSSAAWFGNFLPILAVYDTNGWHTEQYYPAGDPFYSETANYNVKVTAPAEYTVVGTGEESSAESEGKRVTSFSAKMVRDFSFAISKEFKIESLKTVTGAYINLCYYSDLQNVQEILSTASQALEYFGKRIAPYPYGSIDIIETGFFLNGGMEYPEVVFVDSEYFSKPGFYDSLIHEVGHQWIYNIIGSNQIKEAWLDEGFVLYIQQGMRHTKQEIDEMMRIDYDLVQTRLKALENRTLLQDLSVYKTWSEYYTVNYLRSKLMFYALERKIGSENFDAFLRLYYSKYSFSTADKNALIAAAEEASGGISLEDFFNGWMSDYTLPPL